MISHNKYTKFKYLGLNIEETSELLSTDQCAYIDELIEVKSTNERKWNSFDQLNKGKAWQLHGLAGQFNWVASQTRLGMPINACEANAFIKKFNC